MSLPGKHPVARVTAMAMWADTRQLTLAQTRNAQRGMSGPGGGLPCLGAWLCASADPVKVHLNG